MQSQRVALRAIRQIGARSPLSQLSRRQASQAAGDNAFIKEREAVKHHAAESTELWRKLSIYVAIPCLLIAAANAYRLYQEHVEHEKHMPPPEERPQYEYMNIRSKLYPWGDGNKTLFWNDKTNYYKKPEADS